ncbi:MAG TPA: VOC family protein [Frankiaceae bacterium]|jgi:predicted enzyme related to lactoylglutathione lyase|nr:VOC family protein [Frankiaceae bacterium]
MPPVPSRLPVATFSAREPARLARFWADVLGRAVAGDATGVLVAGEKGQLDLRFVPGRAERAGPNRMHLHLTSDSLDHQRSTVATALDLGARHLDVGQRPEEEHVVLADPEGNELCVIEAGNAFLAGCGFLGELACDGSRAVGAFWSAALEWPLVWDRDDETAIQSPGGGTKLAWGGASDRPRETGTRLDLVAPGRDLAAETERLVALGATHLRDAEDGAVVLADPDGYELHLTAPADPRLA